MVSAFQQETGDPEERLAQKRARDAAGNLIVARGRRGFAGDFPERAPGKRIGHRRPVAQAVRPRDPVIHRPLIGMQELIDLEWIVVDDPGAAQIAADRGWRDLDRGIDQQPPREIHSGVHRHDLDRRKNVAFVTCISFRRRGSHDRARRACGVQSAREHGAKRPGVGRSHASGGASRVPPPLSGRDHVSLHGAAGTSVISTGSPGFRILGF